MASDATGMLGDGVGLRARTSTIIRHSWRSDHLSATSLRSCSACKRVTVPTPAPSPPNSLWQLGRSFPSLANGTPRSAACGEQRAEDMTVAPHTLEHLACSCARERLRSVDDMIKTSCVGLSLYGWRSEYKKRLTTISYNLEF